MDELFVHSDLPAANSCKPGDCDSHHANPHAHTWVVFSTALTEGWLMLQCCDCGQHGVVTDPSADEWSTAFEAPSGPYEWLEVDRVVIKTLFPTSPRYVVRATPGSRCICLSKRGIVEPEMYERFPVEVMTAETKLDDQDRQALSELADVVVDGRLCSFLIELFVTSFERETGLKQPQGLLDVVRRIDALDQMGLHCSPAIVATVLTQVARK